MLVWRVILTEILESALRAPPRQETLPYAYTIGLALQCGVRSLASWSLTTSAWNLSCSPIPFARSHAILSRLQPSFSYSKAIRETRGYCSDVHVRHPPDRVPTASSAQPPREPITPLVVHHLYVRSLRRWMCLPQDAPLHNRLILRRRC